MSDAAATAGAAGQAHAEPAASATELNGHAGRSALVAGVGAKALPTDMVGLWRGCATASAPIVFSALCLVASVWPESCAGGPSSRPDIRRLPPTLLSGINGFLVPVSCAPLVGTWKVRR